MTCKECVHYEVCAYRASQFKSVGVEVDWDEENSADVCMMSREKSRFVWLPCSVGRTLYFLYDNRYANKPEQTPKILETQDWYFDIDKYGISILPRNVHGYKGVYHYYLNKTVFLSREDAEKALKEREKV